MSVVNSAAPATLGIGSNYTIGTGTATLTVGASGQTGIGSLTFLTSETSTSTLTVNHTAATTAITIGVSTSVPAILNFNTSNFTTDLISTPGNIVVNAATINFNVLYGGALAAGTASQPLTYPLITTTGAGSTADILECHDRVGYYVWELVLPDVECNDTLSGRGRHDARFSDCLLDRFGECELEYDWSKHLGDCPGGSTRSQACREPAPMCSSRPPPPRATCPPLWGRPSRSTV